MDSDAGAGRRNAGDGHRGLHQDQGNDEAGAIEGEERAVQLGGFAPSDHGQGRAPGEAGAGAAKHIGEAASLVVVPTVAGGGLDAGQNLQDRDQVGALGAGRQEEASRLAGGGQGVARGGEEAGGQVLY